MATSVPIRRGSPPRIAALILALAALLALPGCWVYSVEPLYEESFSGLDPDLTFEQDLVGSWLHTDTDNDCLWILTIAASKEVYTLTMAPSPECKSEGKITNEDKMTRYEAHLIKLGSHRFLDVAPDSTDVCDSCLGLHSFFLLTQEHDALALAPVDDDWLKAAIAKKKVTLAHLNDNLTLTASSKDLKAFLRKYADDKAAFKPNLSLMFKRK